jgi:plasmid stability protein
MALLQIRDLPEDTLRTLKSRAAEQGLSLTAYVRRELDRLAQRPTNSDVVARLAARNRPEGPSVQEIVNEIRRTRETS